MENKIPLLTKDDIEVKIKQCTAKGAVALLYKTARVDMAILDEVFGAENWECDYKEIKGNLYCGIGVHSDNCVVWKWDCGIESREDSEGNQKKGEASDAFKRAGTKWGIGRELYTSPFVFLAVETEQDGRSYKLKDKFARFEVAEIGYDESRRINRLVITDTKGNVYYSYGGSQKAAENAQEKAAAPKVDQTSTEKVKVPQNANKLVCPVCGEIIRKYVKNDGIEIEPQAALDKLGMCVPCYLKSKKAGKANGGQG